MKTAWKILGIAISVLSIAWGIELAFYFDLFYQTSPWAISTTAYISFGLFGLPTTIIPIAIGVVMSWLIPSSWSSYDTVIDWFITIGMVLSYLIQWQYLAWKCFRQSKNIDA